MSGADRNPRRSRRGGRQANRIAGGSFVLDGCRYVLPCNEPGVALHGGTDGFDRRRFTAEPMRTALDGTRSVTLRRTSPDGENGFPGNLAVAVTYAVRGQELSIEHTATTDRPTVVNLTNHAYLNLAGPGGSVEDHRYRSRIVLRCGRGCIPASRSPRAD